MHEQFGYAYDKAWNLNSRTNNALVQSFVVNNLNELSSGSRSGTLTVAGSATEYSTAFTLYGISSATINGAAANLYEDGTFALGGFSPANGLNTYTATAQDNEGRSDTNSVTVNLPATPSFAYDANGNLTNDGTRSFAYDDENELTAVWITSSWSNSFAYDGMMRKRIEKDYSWNAGTFGWQLTNEVHFVYDGYLVLQERDTNNLPITTYTRGNDLSGTLHGAGGIGGLLARSDRTSVVPNILSSVATNQQFNSYYFGDAMGNVVGLVSQSGMLLAQYEYDPYGNVISMSGLMAKANKYRFSSKEWNEASGLYSFGFRFYEPTLQRWINRDPISELGGKNLYGFVGNNPVNLADALGLCDPPTPEQIAQLKGQVDAAQLTLQELQSRVPAEQENLANIEKLMLDNPRLRQEFEYLPALRGASQAALKNLQDRIVAAQNNFNNLNSQYQAAVAAASSAAVGVCGTARAVFAAPTAGESLTGFGVTGGAISGTAILGTALAGAGIGYGISQIPVGEQNVSGENVSGVMGQAIYEAGANYGEGMGTAIQNGFYPGIP